MLDFKAEHWRDSNDYRKAFFRRNKPLLGEIWICSQCWLPMLGNNMVQVDHIFPGSFFVKDREKKNSFFATCFNTEINTSPICPKCNKIKSDKIGFWMILNGITMKVAVKVTGFVQTFFILWAYFIILCLHFARRIVLSRANKAMLKQKKGTKYRSKRKVSFKGIAMPLFTIILVILIIYMSSRL